MSSNDVILVGNLTREVEIRYTNGGSAVATFDIAVNRRWQNRDSKDWEEEVSFFTVTAWRDLAENVAESIGSGDRVMVAGRLQQRSWESKEGEKRYKVEVVADEVGPSLRWATAEITKNERSDAGNGRRDASSEDDRRDEGRRSEGGRSSNGSGRSSRDDSGRRSTGTRSNGRRDYGRDEEPF